MNVPISMGSDAFRTVDFDGFRVARVSFPAGATLPYHSHDRPILGVMLDGSFENRFRGRALSCRPGTAFIEPGGESHSNRVGTRGADLLVIQPDPGAPDLDDLRQHALDEISAFDHPALYRTAVELARELADPDGLTPVSGRALSLEALVHAARFRRPPGHDAPAWFTTLVELLHERFREPPTMRELAAVAEVHPSTIARMFRREKDCSVGEYLRRLRLDWAAARVSGTGADLSRIAAEAGYSDQSHMTREFKRRMGMPPGAYRRLHG